MAAEAPDRAGDNESGYGLIDTASANVLGWYPSECAAVRVVAEDVRLYGATAPEVRSLGLFFQQRRHTFTHVAEGNALVARALQSVAEAPAGA
jgi:hypothetical protein